ncbi:outer membrane protein assembly factor BamB [Lysobacter sp. GX 14042]|uniref:outer membrane protein assembly factor BamB n=1 Tax=Lysobacter sp. GX 14042 TaxID=2907155 RepID=UPI001F1923AB|nr:outer membrane protein assembly factor BamB [Lysobacter sp. GX 14042]MCE7031380.1 outer membrane protein assembly factor BamB [Lysobacter sp. GX 14042]
MNTVPASAARPGAPRLPGLARVALVACCVVAVAGCSTVRGWFSKDDDKEAGPAPLVEFAPTASIQKLWSASAGKGEGKLGVGQVPAVADGRVFAAAVRGGVRAYDLRSGAQVWHYPSDLRLSGGPGVGDGLVVVGGLDGEVVALDAASGEERWSAQVGNEVISAPMIGLGMVFVRSNDGRLTAFDVRNGERRWFWNHDVPPLSVRGNGRSVLGPGYVFIGNDDGTLVALAAGDGRPLWEVPVGQQEGRTELDRMADVDGQPLLDGTAIYATSFKGTTIAIDAPSGQPMWASENGGLGGLAAGASVLVATAGDGTVYGLDKTTGSALWQQPGLLRRGVSAPAAQGEYAVVGDAEGYLHWMRLYNGEFAARTRLGRDPVRGAPVVSDGILVVQDTGGRLAAYQLGQQP